MINKRGQGGGMSWIVITLIIAVVVLVVLLYGFNVGYGGVFKNLIGYGGGSVNVQTHINSCNIACSTQSTFDYCSRVRKIVFVEGAKADKFTCFKLTEPPIPQLSPCDSISPIECKAKSDRALGVPVAAAKPALP